MTDNTEALPPLPEDSRERENFDSTTTELYGGDALAQVQRTLTIFSRQAPPSGSYAKILAIFANEVGKARAALAQRQQVPEARMRETLEFIAQHFSSDWPERCQSHVLAARHCLTAAPSAQAEPSQRQGCATTSESAEPKAKAEHAAEDRADNPERARRSASLGGAALAQAEPQVPLPPILFDGYAVYQALNEKAQSRTSTENVSDVLDAVVRLLRGIGKQEGK